MTEPDRRRARSFGSEAAAYAEHRPGFPVEALRWALEVSTRSPTRVLDLGAGTGKVAEQALRLGLDVVAVEPDDDMRGELARRLPAATALAGTAEQIPLVDSSVDAVLVGQAFHWFDLDAALTEIARVLRPGGVLGVLWNGEDTSVEWVAGLHEASRTSVPDGFAGDLVLPRHDAFDPPERTRLKDSYRRTIDSLIATLTTHSRMLLADAAERATVLERTRRYLRSRPETAGGEFDLPLNVDVVRVRRR